MGKVTLVKLICENNGEPEPPSPKAEFTGALSSVLRQAEHNELLVQVAKRAKRVQILVLYYSNVYGRPSNPSCGQFGRHP